MSPHPVGRRPHRTPDLAHAIMRAARRGIEIGARTDPEAAGIKPARAEAIRRLDMRRQRAIPMVRKAIPLSVKTRLGYDAVIVDRWIEHLLLERPAVISLHGRTLQQMYRGEADWRSIARAAAVVRGTDTMLFGNGDVHSLEEVVNRVREAGVDGVLIGRAVLGAPWWFRDKETARRAAQTGNVLHLDPWTPPLMTRFDILLQHARHFERHYGNEQFRRMRKHLGWYCKGFPHAAALRAAMFRVSSVTDVESVLADHFADRIDGQPPGTASMELSPIVTPCG